MNQGYWLLLLAALLAIFVAMLPWLSRHDWTWLARIFAAAIWEAWRNRDA